MGVTTSPMLRDAKSIWSYNPLPTGCILYLPLWHPDLGGPTFNTIGPARDNCVVTTATYGVDGRSFVAATPDYIEITPTPMNLNFIGGDFSIIMRVTTGDDTGTQQALFSRGASNIDGYQLWFYNDGRLFFKTAQTPAAEQNTFTAGGVIAHNTAQTIGVSRSGAAAKLYLNGVDVTNTAGVHINPTTTTKTVKLGVADNKTSIPYNGVISDVWVGGVNLTTIQHLHAHNVLSRRV